VLPKPPRWLVDWPAVAPELWLEPDVLLKLLPLREPELVLPDDELVPVAHCGLPGTSGPQFAPAIGPR
jgi:hypothetical protein